MASHEPRVVGGHSMHVAHDPSKCDDRSKCGPWRTVDCCKQSPDKDIGECASCGKQVIGSCAFDEDYS